MSYTSKYLWLFNEEVGVATKNVTPLNRSNIDDSTWMKSVISCFFEELGQFQEKLNVHATI